MKPQLQERKPPPNPSVEESHSRRFGFGRKCLVVFGAAIVASLIVHWLEGPPVYTEIDKAFNVDPDLQNTLPSIVAAVFGGAIFFSAIAMVIAVFVPGRTGAIIGVALVAILAYLQGSTALKIRNISHTVAPMHAQQRH